MSNKPRTRRTDATPRPKRRVPDPAATDPRLDPEGRGYEGEEGATDQEGPEGEEYVDPENDNEGEYADPEDDESDESLYNKLGEERQVDDDGLDPRQAQSLRILDALGTHGFENPRTSHRASAKVLKGIADTPIFAGTEIEGQTSWQIEIEDPENDDCMLLGRNGKNIGWTKFIRKYISSMPAPHSPDAAVFHFKALDKMGKVFAGTERIVKIPWHHEQLIKYRRENPESENLAGRGTDAVLTRFMERSLEAAERREAAAIKAAAEAQKEARAVAERAMQDRANAIASDNQSIGQMYQAVNAVQKEGFSSLLTTADKLALEREKREGERAERDRVYEQSKRDSERAERDEARKQLALEAEIKLKAAAGEAAARLAEIKAETAAKIEQAAKEADAKALAAEKRAEENARLRKEELEAKDKEAQRKADAEIERIRSDATREQLRLDAQMKASEAALAKEQMRLEAVAKEQEAARKEREAERKEARDREDARILAAAVKEENARKEREAERKEEQRRDEERRTKEQERRDKMDLEERTRQNNHVLEMEKLRQETLQAQQARLTQERVTDKEFRDREDARSKEHLQTMLKLVEQRNAGDKPDIMALVEKGLNFVGLTPGTALEAAQKFLPLLSGEGQSGMGVTIVKGIFDSIQEGIKRIPIPTGEEDDDEWEDEEEEEATVTPTVRKPKRITKQPDPEPVTPKVKEPVRAKPKGPGLDAFLKNVPDAPATPSTPAAPAPAAAEPEPDAPPAVPTMPAEPAPPGTISLAEAKAGRLAMAELVEALEDTEDWQIAIMALDAADALMSYVTRVGLIEAADGYDIDIDKLGAALVSLGLFSEPPMVGVKP